jgi:hypothetical protein
MRIESGTAYVGAINYMLDRDGREWLLVHELYQRIAEDFPSVPNPAIDFWRWLAG